MDILKRYFQNYIDKKYYLSITDIATDDMLYDRHYSYGEILDATLKLVNILSTKGIKKGMPVGIYSENRAEWIIAMNACMLIGAPYLALNTGFNLSELKYIINKHQPQLIFTSKKQSNISDFNYPLINFDEDFWELIDNVPDCKRVASYSYLKELSDTDIMCIQFTSGTTSMPKAVAHTYREVLTTVYEVAKSFNYKETDKILLTIPLYHQMGCNLTAMISVVSKASIVMMPFYKTKDVLATLKDKECTSIHAVSSILKLIVQKGSNLNFPYLKCAVVGGSIISNKEIKELNKSLHLKYIMNVYGMTETFVIAIGKVTNKTTSDFTGTILNYVKVCLSDQNEFIVKSPTAATCYLDDYPYTSEVFQTDGIHTGDIGELLTNNKLLVTSRCKDIIVRGGENISSRLIESTVQELDGVLQAVVTSVPDPIMGEEIVLFVKGTVCEEKILNYCKQHLDKHQIPKYIKCVEDIPMTANGKVIKWKLLKSFLD